MQTQDNGDWLSAQQAVRPDGTEVSNLPLINKKLPPLVRPQDVSIPDVSEEPSTLPSHD
jgi:hypothetical protein|nr:hypothetical protein [uncultured Undibacterium sp.]